MKILLLLVFAILSIKGITQKRNPKNMAVFLEDISWTSARELLTSTTVMVIPLGAGAKEHGPHLPLATDLIQAEGIARQLAIERNVVITPAITFGFYPAFLKYAGSTSLNFTTGVDVVLQVVRSLAAYGPRRFYIVNIGVSTTPTLEKAAMMLAEEGILLYFSRYDRPNFQRVEYQLKTRDYGGHADEIETSNLLHLRPDLVNMKKAVDDSSLKNKPGMMTPVPVDGGSLNPSGINGYATLATPEKGRLYIAAFSHEVIKEIDSVSSCALPPVKERTNEYLQYEGTYTDATGNQLIITQKNNILYFVWQNRDFRNFVHLSKNATDYFTSLTMNILFVKNETGKVTKAWCQNRGESFWVTKSNN